MGKEAQLNDSWWEAFAAARIPAAQKAIIDALREAGQPLSEALLTATTERRPEGRPIKHHLARLRGLSAIEFEVSATGPERITYRLTEKPGRERREEAPGGPVRSRPSGVSVACADDSGSSCRALRPSARRSACLERGARIPRIDTLLQLTAALPRTHER